MPRLIKVEKKTFGIRRMAISYWACSGEKNGWKDQQRGYQNSTAKLLVVCQSELATLMF
jgi:hypothetical protein